MTKAQMKQWLFNSLNELQEEFTGYEERGERFVGLFEEYAGKREETQTE